MARLMSWLRSYVVIIFTFFGRLFFSVFSLFFTAAIIFRAFLSDRRIIISFVISFSSFSSVMFRRIFGLIWIFVISRR